LKRESKPNAQATLPQIEHADTFEDGDSPELPGQSP